MGFESNKNNSLGFNWILMQMAVKRTNVLPVFVIASCINTAWILKKGTWDINTEEQQMISEQDV